MGSRFRDHPRTRGEKCDKLNFSAWGKGSPPHTRGKATASTPKEPPIGITPAHAGKSSKVVTLPNDKEGSPPHTRGKGIERGHAFKRPGITPAHAGKSFARKRFHGWDWDHPRTRGEKFPSLTDEQKALRITPAHAGKRLNGSRF